VNKRFFLYLKESIEKKTNRWELYLWLLLHIGLPLLFLISILTLGPVGINTSLFDMLPRSSYSKAVMNADAILGEKNGREIIILSAANDFESAKKGASLFYEHFKDSDDFENINFYFDSSVMDDFNRFLFDYRFVIAGEKTIELLENGMADVIAYDALASAYGAFNFFPLDRLDKDPFLLAERRMGDFLSSSLLAGAMALKDDVIAAEKDGIHYVILRMTLAPGKVSLQADKNAVGKIYSKAADIKKTDENFDFYFSGIPFHSYESSSGAQKEISIISTITLILILIIFLYVFRSALPVVFSTAAIAISIGMAAAAALLVFREIHIITFVFGTTLIGTCVDYSVHFFINWKYDKAANNGAKIRASVLKNITMSFISTQICFFVFFLAPFPILKQFAVFSMAGLLSSYLTFFCIYPRLKVPKNKKTEKQESKIKRLYNRFARKLYYYVKIPVFFRKTAFKNILRPVILTCFLSVVITLLAINYSSVKIENNISSLYTMSDFMFESEKRTAQVLDYGSPGWYFIVSGSSENETLENEERLIERLQQEITAGNLESYLAATIFVPSIKTQKKNYEAMKALLPLSAKQFEYLGFTQEYAAKFKQEFEDAQNYCLIKDAPAQAGISNLWIGQSGENFYTCILPLKPKDEKVFREIAQEMDFVHFVNKAKDIGNDMDTITRTMLFLFLAAYVIVSVIICFIYPWKDSIKICSVPLLLVLASVTILAVNKIYIGFFSVAALVLVFGLSLDYIFFMTGKKKKNEKKLTLLGVFLSFLTTLLSFGALSFSNFMPVHLFGLTVCAGLGAAFISALILQAKVDVENHRISGFN